LDIFVAIVGLMQVLVLTFASVDCSQKDDSSRQTDRQMNDMNNM